MAQATTADQGTLIRQLQEAVAALTTRTTNLEGAVLSGTGSPENVVPAAVGTLYRRTDGGTGSTFYVKETGGVTATGWTAK